MQPRKLRIEVSLSKAVHSIYLAVPFEVFLVSNDFLFEGHHSGRYWVMCRYPTAKTFCRRTSRIPDPSIPLFALDVDVPVASGLDIDWYLTGSILETLAAGRVVAHFCQELGPGVVDPEPVVEEITSPRHGTRRFWSIHEVEYRSRRDGLLDGLSWLLVAAHGHEQSEDENDGGSPAYNVPPLQMDTAGRGGTATMMLWGRTMRRDASYYTSTVYEERCLILE